MKVIPKNVFKALCFILILSFMFIKVSYALRPHGGDHVYIRTFLMQPSNTIDVAYVGASACLVNWVPMEAYGLYGFTTFNFGSSAMPPQLFKYSIIEVLKNQSPEVLILDITTLAFPEVMLSEASIRYVTDNIRYSFNRFSAIQNGAPKEQSRLNYHFDIAKYHSEDVNLLKTNNWRYAFNIPDDNTKYFGGFRPVIKYAEIERTDNSDIIEKQPFSNDINQVYLDLIDYCANLDASVIFIVAPFDETEEQRKNFNYARGIAKDKGITFFSINDMFDEIGLDVKTDFYDERHMQIFGAKKYTQWLGQYLKDKYDLPDRREDPAYVDWDIAYELWQPKKTEIEQSIFELMPEDVHATLLE